MYNLGKLADFLRELKRLYTQAEKEDKRILYRVDKKPNKVVTRCH